MFRIALPLVLNRRSDVFQVLQKCPFSSIQPEELLKQEPKKPEVPIESPKHETLKIETLQKEVEKSINRIPKNSLGSIVAISSEPVIDSSKIPGDNDIKLSVVDKSSHPLKVVTVESSNQKTLLRAFVLDIMQMQYSLGVLLAKARVKVTEQIQKTRTNRNASGPIWAELKHKEVELFVKKNEPKPKEEPLEIPPLKSNLGEAIQQNLPAWQKSISISLGNLQKTVVKKLAK
ncbi:uncharacterized protein LOC128985773 isoform X2 [Macrosteles quadrilineatus]|nr:uncharacterized protein LOC128985773 isoform X2 [Macrosteles quadrilineatus]